MQGVTLSNTYEDITVKQVIELSKIKKPEFFEKLITGEIEGNSLSVKDLQRVLPNFYREIFAVLTDKPLSYFKKVNPHAITYEFNSHVMNFYLSVIYDNFDDVEPVEYYKIDNERYYLPKDNEMFGTIIPSYYSTFGQWSDSMDSLNIVAKELEGGNFEVLPMVMSIMCLKKGEEYTEEKAISRMKLFENVKYSKARFVFFCLREQINSYAIHTAAFTRKLAEAEKTALNEHPKKTMHQNEAE